jgi:translation initiation factor IF-2
MILKRPPVVAILGHIDHGKSSLLDYIRNTNIVAKEAGGITQHTSAYEVRTENGDKITFLDTPGHEAFQGQRARGANVADIAILVVSAEDGVKPQTKEAYENIKAGGAPFIVAITKTDKPSADVDRTKQSLAEAGIYVEGYGGNVSFVPVSSKTGDGIKDLLEMILLTADLESFTGETDENGSGMIIESRLDPKKGVTATAVIKNGTVRRGLFAASKGSVAPLRYLLDSVGAQEDELSFSSPVQITGWDALPQVGAEFRTFLKKDEAEAYAESEKEKDLKPQFEAKEGVSTLSLIVKADTLGSLEAISAEINKLGLERITPRIIISGVGSIAESDVKLALASENAVILGFHTKVDAPATRLAESNGITVSLYNIIYELTDKVRELLKEREPRIEVEESIGTAKVLKCFSSSKDKQVLGARCQAGDIKLGAQVKIIRRESEIGRGKVKELQQAKVAVDTVNEGNEFGAMVESKVEIAPGDILEATILVTK